ncbi:MAG TPA: LysR substrate-binding domain-containing protein [Woeseiaceae bacterium]|nr:LysR substrate-binding domain-containing protein [Woeseiaceae bacterium]
MTPINRNISLRGLRAFCFAAEHESFRDAAEKLFITASAVSHQIKNLEDELGQKLFDRTSRSLTLTEAGLSLLQDIKPLITRLDEVAARHRVSTARGTLSISVQPFFASELFIPKLPEFTRDHPDIDIKVDTSDESAEKHPATADVSIRVFRSAPAGYASDRLFPLRLIPAASPELRKKIVVDETSISGDVPLLVHDSRPSAWRQWSQSSGMEVPRDASIIRLDSMIAIARAAERGLGAALVPVQLSDAWFESGSLVPLSDHELPTRDAYYFVCRVEDADNETIQTLRRWVLQNFDG